MKRFFYLVFISISFCVRVSFGAPSTQVTYNTINLGSGQWENIYDVKNISLTAGIEEFTIWFDYNLYDNLTIKTTNPPASNWSEIVWQPDPIWSINGGYDALILGSSIGVGQHVGGFAVSYDWLGLGMPGSQFYEIVDPITYETIDSGQTSMIPAPNALILTIIGLVALKSKQKFLRTS